MPKVSVYLPDELYRRARDHGLSLSSVTQEAVERRLSDDDNARWVERMGNIEPRTRAAIDTSELLDEVREGFGR